MRATPQVHRTLAAVLLSAAPIAVLAHTGADAGTHHGLASGVMHPFTGLDHLAAMLAVGAWSALAAPAARWRDWIAAPLAFALLLLAGALFAAGGIALPAIEPMIATSLLVLGLLVASRRSLPVAAGAVLAGTFALFHGAAHGQELAGAAAIGGMVLATALLHGIGLAIGHALRRRSAWWPRVAGLATTAFGAALLLA
jgi:urease accessory protein